MAIADIAIQIITKGANLAKQQLDGLSGSTGKASGKFSQLAKAGAVVGTVVGVGLVKAISSATREFVQFDDAMTQSVAIMQTTDAQQKAMAESARQVATETRISATDSAEAFFFLASAGLDAEQSISALPQVAKFAQAGMFDMATATDLATDAQSALGLTVSDAQQNLENLTRVTDVLVKANTLANASVQQFSEALTNKAGSALKVANKSIEEGVAVLAAFADRGVKGAEAGEKLNQLLRDIPRATAKNSEEFAKLGLNMFDTEGNMKNVADIIEELDAVLGPLSDELKASTLDQLGLNRGVADAVKILSGAGDSIRAFQDKLSDAGGTTQEVADNQLNSLQGQLELLESKVTEVGLAISDALSPALSTVVGLLNDFLDGILLMNDESEDGATRQEQLAKNFNLTESALHSSNQALNDKLLAEQKLRRATDERNKQTVEYFENQHRQKLIEEDLINNLHELDRETSTFQNTTEDITSAIEDQTSATEDLVKQQNDKQFDALMRLIHAEEAYNEIFKENERLLEERDARVTDLGKADDKLTSAEQKLAEATARANELANDGIEISNEEALAIARQKQRIEELVNAEEQNEIQLLELAVARERLDELEAQAIERSSESIQAEKDVERAMRDVEKATEDVARATERLNDANDKIEESQSASALGEIAEAHKELKEAIADVDAFDNFFGGISIFAEGTEQSLSDVFNMLQKIKNFDSGVATTPPVNTNGGSTKFETDGSIIPEEIVTPLSSSKKAGNVSMSPIVNQVINQTITVEGKSANEQALDIIEAVNKAQRNGQRFVL